ncbi:unnamed protein product [Staurois parvus]|uniref:Ribosomal protein L32 n=1 Tax=Staurois parvus TaxID=386267 RepID=A0ABN9GTL7_9NEOB|nr:unnamed protein product [Staurois parvus]
MLKKKQKKNMNNNIKNKILAKKDYLFAKVYKKTTFFQNFWTFSFIEQIK